MSNKVSEEEENEVIVKDSVSTIKESTANIKEQIKTEVEQLLKIQPCVSKQVAGQTAPMVKTEKHMENKTICVREGDSSS